MNAAYRSQHLIVASFVALLTLVIAGCGGGLSGTYTPDGKSFGGALISDITFTSGNKVEVTAQGVTGEGTYEVDGKRVKFTTNGSTTLMTIDDSGCLDAGVMFGKFCKK
jgi:hypothetical protein